MMPLFVLGVKPDDTVNGLGRIDRVKRREDKVTGFGGFEGDLSGLKISHLTNQDDLRSLTKCGAKGRCKILGIGTDLALIDGALFVHVEKLDRILDRDYVICLYLVNTVDYRRKRRTLSRTSRPGQQNNAVPDLGDLGQLRRQAEEIRTSAPHAGSHA